MSNFFGIIKKRDNFDLPDISALLSKNLAYKNSHFSFETDFDISIFDDDQLIVMLCGFVSNISELCSLSNDVFNSQAEGVAKIYKNNPANFQEKFLGNFVISIFDKNKQELVLVRDHFGARPLYLINHKNFFAFSTNLGLLADSELLILNINMQTMVNFLSLQVNEGNKTFYEEIDRLEASHILNLNKSAVHISAYSHVSSSNNKVNQRPLTAFTKKFEDAISRSFVGKKKIGLRLSGGLDSTAIAIGMKNLGIKGVETFSANYRHLPQKHLHLTDETNYQAAVKSVTGYNHNFVSLENISPLESLEKQANYFDEPIHIPNLYLFEKIAAQAKSKNIGIIFDGNDGDTVVSHGFERFEELLRSLNFIGFIYELCRYALFNQVKLKQFVKSIGHNILLKWGLREKSKKNSSIVQDSVLFDSKFCNDYFQTAVDSHLDKLKSPLHALAFEYRYLIFKYYDIEIRSPFYDLELINLCVSLPSRWKLRHGRSRYILRSYLKGKVPDLVSQRRNKANLIYGIIYNIEENDIKKIKKELENIHPLLENIINQGRISESINLLKSKNEITDFEVTSLLGFFSANRWLRNNQSI